MTTVYEVRHKLRHNDELPVNDLVGIYSSKELACRARFNYGNAELDIEDEEFARLVSDTSNVFKVENQYTDTEHLIIKEVAIDKPQWLAIK